jgi:hypothetical protein
MDRTDVVLQTRTVYVLPTTFQSLDDIAYAISDNEAAKRLQEAKHQLFESIDERLLAG